MAASATELVAGIIDRIEERSPGPGRPPMPTIKVVETLRFFVREGVQWRELRAETGRACGSAVRPCAVASMAGAERPCCAGFTPS